MSHQNRRLPAQLESRQLGSQLATAQAARANLDAQIKQTLIV